MNQTQTAKFKRALNRHYNEPEYTDSVETKPLFDTKRFDKINYTRINIGRYYGSEKPLVVTGEFKCFAEDKRFVFVDIKPYIKGKKRELLQRLCDHINIFVDEAAQICHPLPMPEKGSIWFMVCEVRQYKSQYNEKRYTLALSDKLGIAPLLSDDTKLKAIPKDKYVEFVQTKLHTFHGNTKKRKPKKRKKAVNVDKVLAKGNSDFVLE